MLQTNQCNCYFGKLTDLLLLLGLFQFNLESLLWKPDKGQIDQFIY